MTNPTERIFTKEMFTEEFKNTIDESKLLSSMDVEVLITYLRRDKREISYDGHVSEAVSPNIIQSFKGLCILDNQVQSP